MDASTDKKIKNAVVLLEKHGYTVTPPESPIVLDTTELNKQKLEKRKQKLIDMMMPFKSAYPSEMLNEFYNYWIEPNRTFTKMRWELQITWDINLRLKTWFRNNAKKYGRKQITDAERADKLADILVG